ncbi:unnamed protein product, partial [Urochloa humidicola]
PYTDQFVYVLFAVKMKSFLQTLRILSNKAVIRKWSKENLILNRCILLFLQYFGCLMG